MRIVCISRVTFQSHSRYLRSAMDKMIDRAGSLELALMVDDLAVPRASTLFGRTQDRLNSSGKRILNPIGSSRELPTANEGGISGRD